MHLFSLCNLFYSFFYVSCPFGFFKFFLCLCNFIFLADKSSLEDAAHSLYGLKKIASNYECIPSLLDGLATYIRTQVLTLTDNVDCPAIDKAINELMNQVLQVLSPKLSIIENQLVRKDVDVNEHERLSNFIEFNEKEQSFYCFSTFLCVSCFI